MYPENELQLLIEAGLKKLSLSDRPQSLYEPVRYMLSIGGKRMRPMLVLMGCKLFGGDEKKALNAALAIEVFHNFTLLHDDIMDKAELRRKKQTVHVRWNESTAILAGDAMFVKSVQLLLKSEDIYIKKLLADFTETALRVCEGQQLDMDFEKRNDVTISDYLHMIECKTAVLLGCSLKLGAIVAGASDEDCDNIYKAGCNLGMAFQLQDDLLDLYGDEERFGKKRGGDIVANKKTFLLLKAMEAGNEQQRDAIDSLSHSSGMEKVKAMKSLFDVLKVQQATEEMIEKYYAEAIKQIQSLHVSEGAIDELLQLAEGLRVRIV